MELDFFFSEFWNKCDLVQICCSNCFLLLLFLFLVTVRLPLSWKSLVYWMGKKKFEDVSLLYRCYLHEGFSSWSEASLCHWVTLDVLGYYSLHGCLVVVQFLHHPVCFPHSFEVKSLGDGGCLWLCLCLFFTLSHWYCGALCRRLQDLHVCK